MITNRTLWLGAYLLSSGLLFAEADVTLPPPIKNEAEPAANWIRHGPHVDLEIVGAGALTRGAVLPSLRLGYSKGVFLNDKSEPRAVLDAGLSIPTLTLAPYVSLRMVRGRWTFGPEVGLVADYIFDLTAHPYTSVRATYALGAPSRNGSGWYMSMSAGVLWVNPSIPFASFGIGYSF